MLPWTCSQAPITRFTCSPALFHTVLLHLPVIFHTYSPALFHTVLLCISASFALPFTPAVMLIHLKALFTQFALLANLFHTTMLTSRTIKLVSGARNNTTLASTEYPLHTVHSHTKQPGSHPAESVRCSSSSQIVSMKLVFHSAYPDSSIADAVMKTLILFRLSVASCSNRSTTLERECIRMV